ncbi:MAG: hypothetical protein LBT91_03790 [Bifidobacteriaceae bacterium]|jgi:hypothetical protein|nr:hypothetical protein [Bifidobacteriaceae bacterium]
MGIFGIIGLFVIASFLAGSFSAKASTSQSPLPISFGGTGAKTQNQALTNLGINSTIDKNSTNETFPNSKAIYDYVKEVLNTKISMDNTSFSNSLTNWVGGDLIIKKKNLNSTAASNKIKVGGVSCITTGQGYTSNSAANDGYTQIGCVLPKLSEGTHNIEISTNGGTNYSTYGQVIYQQTPNLAGCDTTSMQTFGSNGTVCKAAMKQGQVIVLNDTRNNQKYRVKKMPDGNVWMIDNLKLGSTTSSTALTPANTNISSNYTLPAISAANRNADPSSQSYCASSGLLWTEAPGTLSGCGYIYNWNIAMAGTSSDSAYSISAKGWGLARNSSGSISHLGLTTALKKAASDSLGYRNPVYSATEIKNFSGTNSPWQGVRSGAWQSKGNQWTEVGGIGNYWSSTNFYNLWYDKSIFRYNDNAASSGDDVYSRSVRSVL